MNKELLDSIKNSMKRYTLSTKYNNKGKLKNNAKINKVILENNKLGNIKFNVGKIWSKNILTLSLNFKSTEHNYRIDWGGTPYFYKPKIEDNILILTPFFSMYLKNEYEDYTTTLQDCKLKIYLTRDGVKEMMEVFKYEKHKKSNSII